MTKLLPFIKNSLYLLFLLISLNGMAAVYYVNSDGNDDNPGTSPEQAWKTLEKVNSFHFWAGDQILFRREDVWRGNLIINNSGSQGKPITYGAYGEGADPIIYGSEVISDWTQHEGNIYKASVTSDIVQVFIDGTRARLARYPNEGYHTINSVSGSTTFTSNNLDTEMNYAGATWLGRTRYWFTVIRDVVSSSSNSITLISSPDGNLAVNIGFILMNKLEFLNQPGEWYYDKTSKELYLWTPDGDSPENYTVTASGNKNGIHINRKNYLYFTNLDFREQGDNGVFIYGSNNIVLDNNHFLQSDRYGISAEGASSLIIKNNKIDRANGGGLWLWTNNSHITDNWIDNTGVFSEIGLKGTGRPNGGSGAEISGEGNVIEYNTIENSNYNGLFYRGAGTKIQYNLINNSCLIKDDGGGIYTNTSGSGGFVRYNIITNSIGNPDGYISNRSMAEGIYIDEVAQNVVVENNTVLNTGDAAIKLHNVGGIKVSNNTVMTARYGIWCNNFVGLPSPITNNIVYMTTNKDDYEPRALFSRVGSYNTQFDYNKYFNPTVSASTQVFRESTYFTFTQWKAATGQDANSVFNSTPLAAGETAELIYNASKKSKKYNLNEAVVKDLEGNSLTESFTLEPYTSIIVIGTNADKIAEAPDTIAPEITSFMIPSVSTSLEVPVLSFIASDDRAVTGYLLTEASEIPEPGAEGWSLQAPELYSFSEPCTYTLYAWAKDDAGNISEPVSGSVTIHIPDYSPTYIEYLFEEPSETTVIDSYGSVDGTLVNEVLRVDGVKNNGLEFTGLGYINAGQAFGDRVGNELSISVWLKPSAGSEGYQSVVEQEGQDSVTYALSVNSTLKSIGFKTSGTSAGWLAVENVEKLWDGNWHHVLVTYNGSEKVIYVDNIPLANVASGGLINSGYGFNLVIGAEANELTSDNSYKGMIDEVRIYNYGLTGDDVSELYFDVIDTTTYAGDFNLNADMHFYPNPFNNYVTIELSGMGNNVKIDVYNATGTLIKSISDGQVSNIRNTYIWNGRNENGENVAPGLYFIRVSSGGTVNTGKVFKLQ